MSRPSVMLMMLAAIGLLVATPTPAGAGPITIVVSNTPGSGSSLPAGVNLSNGSSIILPFAGQLTSATLTVNTKGASTLPFGAFTTDINGISLGYAFRSPLADAWSFSLSGPMLAAVNQAGFVQVRLDFGGSFNGLMVDSLELTGQVAPVPESGTLVLFGLGLIGMSMVARPRRRA